MKKDRKTLVDESGQASQDLMKQSEQARLKWVKRKDAILTITGFAIGLIAAIIAVYLFIWWRVLQNAEQEHIELPRDKQLSASMSGPATHQESTL